LGNLSFSFAEIIAIIYFAAIAVQLIYYWIIFGRFAFFRETAGNKFEQPVSVVISAKNEYLNLKENLPLILDQKYPNFEVVVVNDASDDETIFLLEDLCREHKNLKIVTIEKDLNFFRGKKFPLAIGIKSASFENLLLTDADCKPSSPEWISHMASGFSNGKEVVLGYGKLMKRKGWLNMVIRFETAFTALQYFSLALWGSPYMGVGRNLAYKKSLFIQNKGFISHYKISSGDDDLFINKVANKSNTQIIINSGSFTLSPAKKTIQEWWRQKRRHLSTGAYYKKKHKLILGGYSATLAITYLLFVVLLIKNYMILIVVSALAIRLISQLFIFYRTYKKLNEKKLLVFSPLIELKLTLIYPVMVFINLIFKESRWK